MNAVQLVKALHAQSVTWQLPGWRELFLKRTANVN